MPDFVYQILIRLAVVLPTIAIASALVWYVLKRFGVVGTAAPFDPRDMRTWPLKFVLTYAALFALVFVIVRVSLSQAGWSDDWTAGIAAFTSGLVAIGLAPRLVTRFT